MKSFLNKEWKSFGHAFRGLGFFFRSEVHAWVHVLAMLVASFGGYYYKISTNEWLVLCLFFALIIALEIVNTAIEKLVDLVSPDYNKLAGQVKDIASAAVLWASFFAIIVAVIIFFPKLFPSLY